MRVAGGGDFLCPNLTLVAEETLECSMKLTDMGIVDQKPIIEHGGCCGIFRKQTSPSGLA